MGLSVSTVEEARKAAELRDEKGEVVIDYVGIGAVWETKSKDVSGKTMLGPSGVGEVLDVLAEEEKKSGRTKMRSVAIGECPVRLLFYFSSTFLSVVTRPCGAA